MGLRVAGLMSIVVALLQHADDAGIVLEDVQQCISDVHNVGNLSPGQETVLPGIPFSKNGAQFSVEIHIKRVNSASEISQGQPAPSQPNRGSANEGQQPAAQVYRQGG